MGYKKKRDRNRYIVGIDEVGRAARKTSLARHRYVIGIDEVGRGPLAGPVVVAAVVLPQSLIKRELHSRIFANKHSSSIRETPLRDSKRLTKKQREAWFKYLKSHPKLKFELARIYPKTVDRMNISRAANLAAARAFNRLCIKNDINPEKCGVFLDGGLYLGNGERPNFSKTVVRGDMKIKTIAMASILAKVARDRIMVRLAKKYPQYGFEAHKGYGTKVHIAAIKKHGPSEVHRRSFDPIAKMLYN